MVYALSEIISQQVFLVDRIEDQHSKSKHTTKTILTIDGVLRDVCTAEHEEKEKMKHLKAVCFIRPTATSIESLKLHLRSPKYKEYHVFFTNIVSNSQLQSLAEADKYELVRQVQEYYGDFYAVDASVFHINNYSTHLLHQSPSYWMSKENKLLHRETQGILSALLSLKRRPIVRYQQSSALCKRLAMATLQGMKEEASLFHFQQQSSAPLLLVLDRRDDPVTPLLNQWTYQAMVHELLGIKDNRVDMRSVSGISKELREVVLSAEQDHFYKGSMYLNFGDLGASIKELVTTYQRKTKNNSKIESVADMQKFVDQYPEFRALAGNVSKHVAMMTELSRIVDQRNLMNVSEVEQALACTQDHTSALHSVLQLLEDRRTTFNDKLRLVLLYALRYESGVHQISTLKQVLRDKAQTPEEHKRVKAVEELLKYGGSQVRSGDLFSNKSFLAKASKFFSTGIQGVENIYTQHRPLLAQTLESLFRGKLRTSDYPILDGGNPKAKFDLVIVYIVGGATYEEAACINQFNEDNNEGCRVLLGGSCIHNSHTFLDQVLKIDRCAL